MLDSSFLLLTDNLHIGIGKLVEAPAVPYRPVTIKVKAVLHTNLDTVLCTLDCKVERLIPVKSASEVLVASSKRVGHPKTSYAAEVLGLVDAVLLSTGCDVHEANGKLLTVHSRKLRLLLLSIVQHVVNLANAGDRYRARGLLSPDKSRTNSCSNALQHCY